MSARPSRILRDETLTTISGKRRTKQSAAGSSELPVMIETDCGHLDPIRFQCHVSVTTWQRLKNRRIRDYLARACGPKLAGHGTLETYRVLDLSITPPRGIQIHQSRIPAKPGTNCHLRGDKSRSIRVNTGSKPSRERSVCGIPTINELDRRESGTITLRSQERDQDYVSRTEPIPIDRPSPSEATVTILVPR